MLVKVPFDSARGDVVQCHFEAELQPDEVAELKEILYRMRIGSGSLHPYEIERLELYKQKMRSGKIVIDDFNFTDCGEPLWRGIEIYNEKS